MTARILVAALFCSVLAQAQQKAASDAELERGFQKDVKPVVTQFCYPCHSGANPAGGFNLKSYGGLTDVVPDLQRWTGVAGRLKANEMPPKGMPQPAADARTRVIEWIETLRWSEARKDAGDPGPVLVRRLSNAEYNYTIRDLTGVDLRPTREFPVDPANTAGFDNSGESLTMSPSLLNKYLQAAREAGDHMALMPDGITFSPYTSLVETDREKFAIQRIVAFYDAQPTDLADYFEAAWRYKHRGEAGMPDATLTEIAVRAKVSPGYLPEVWRILGETHDETLVDLGPIHRLRAMWKALPAADPSSGELRAQCVAMRDFVLRIRKDTVYNYAAPVVDGLPPTSQPLMNWKLRQYAAHRRDFDPASLRNDTDPPPVVGPVPGYADLGEEAALRWNAIVAKSRAEDPDLVVPQAQRKRYEKAFAQFAAVFPDAFYIRERGRYFPDDSADKGRLLSAGYHNVMGYFRDDKPLMDLILDEKGKRELDRLWDDFDFLADYTERTWVQYYFNQSGEVLGTGRESSSARPSDKAVSSPEVIFGMRDLYLKKAEASHNAVAVEAIQYHFSSVNKTLRALEKERAAAEGQHLRALLQFAARAYRRPLSQAEQQDLVSYYHVLRDKSELSHQEAIRDCIVSVLMSPKFMYRVDLAPATDAGVLRPVSTGSAGEHAVAAVPDYALASRLSYFVWSSMPDDELLAHAAKQDLHQPDVLTAQVRRMLKDPRATGMATEFGGNWLGFRQFEQYNSVDRARFPSFNDDLREAMFQEPIRFIADMIANDRPVLDLVYGKYTFVNPVLAKHYGMPPVSGGNDHWVHVDDADRYGRGGILPMAVFLTMNAPGLRTSPVKRGKWVVQSVMGIPIPAPPPNVPQLPDDEAKSDMPVRQMLEKHRSVPFCASCHARFDSFGLAFEGYGPVGDVRQADLAGRPVDTAVDFPGGDHGVGLDGIRKFIREHRENDVIDNLSRKLLAFALGRSLMLSDEPLVEDMHARLQANGYRFSALVEAIAASPQFLNQRVATTQMAKGG